MGVRDGGTQSRRKGLPRYSSALGVKRVCVGALARRPPAKASDARCWRAGRQVGKRHHHFASIRAHTVVGLLEVCAEEQRGGDVVGRPGDAGQRFCLFTYVT